MEDTSQHADNGRKRGETFVLVDCGGGTTDIGTYRIAHAYPLRLNSEVNDLSGKLRSCL